MCENNNILNVIFITGTVKRKNGSVKPIRRREIISTFCIDFAIILNYISSCFLQGVLEKMYLIIAAENKY